MITYDILFSDGRVSYGVASNIAAATRRAMRIAQREGIRVVSVSDRYAPRRAVQTGHEDCAGDQRHGDSR